MDFFPQHNYNFGVDCSISDFYTKTPIGRKFVGDNPLLPSRAVNYWFVNVTDTTDARKVLSENSINYVKSPWKADVIQIFEGDYLLTQRIRTKQKIILAGIVCPDPGQPFHKEAKTFVSKMILHKNVNIDLSISF